MVEIFTNYYPINDAARALYDQLMQDHRCLFVNSGNLKGSKDPWIQQHVVFETDFEDNIADKNHLMNELTAWWTAKNHLLNDVPDDEWVKCSHYRKRIVWDSPFIREDDAFAYVCQTLPLAKQQQGEWIEFSIGDGWSDSHPQESWDEMERCLKRHLSDEDFQLYVEWKNFTLFIAPLNIYAMKKRDMMSYWDWQFPMVFELAESLPLHKPEYQTLYQRRQLGFISEMFLSLWMFMQRKKGLRVIQAPFVVYNGFKPISDEEERMTKI